MSPVITVAIYTLKEKLHESLLPDSWVKNKVIKLPYVKHNSSESCKFETFKYLSVFSYKWTKHMNRELVVWDECWKDDLVKNKGQ